MMKKETYDIPHYSVLQSLIRCHDDFESTSLSRQGEKALLMQLQGCWFLPDGSAVAEISDSLATLADL